MKFFKSAYQEIPSDRFAGSQDHWKHMAVIALLVFSLATVFPVFSQDQDMEAEYTPEQKSTWDFLLIPILETVFSGNIQWRPDWPADIPPDGFLIQQGDRLPAVIELSNETERFIVRRDRESRLAEFPFFYAENYIKVEAAYTPAGALQSMSLTLKNYAFMKDDTQPAASAERASASEGSPPEETINVTFPAGFIPYSNLSPGGSFPTLRVNSGDSVFFVYIFESPLFLTETWYDSSGNMIVFCKASVNVENGAWRIRSLQIHDAAADMRFVDFFYDSNGNITEVNDEDNVFSAIFIESRPSFWQWNDLQYELQWDTQWILSVVKASGENGGLIAEYRYGYERDTLGNWVVRWETAYVVQADLLVSRLSYSRGIWRRRIVF